METTRRLSLTLLLVAPLMTAQEMDAKRLRRYQEPDSVEVFGDYHPNGTPSSSEEVIDENPIWFRRRRDLDTTGEEMETAEQLYFRPMFRHRQIVEERLEREKLREQMKIQRTGPADTVPAQREYKKITSFTQYPSVPKKAAFRSTVDGAVFRSARSVHPLWYHRLQ